MKGIIKFVLLLILGGLLLALGWFGMLAIAAVTGSTTLGSIVILFPVIAIVLLLIIIFIAIFNW